MLPLRWTLVLVDRGVKELEDCKLSTSIVVRFERDARTMSLVSSFVDMMGAASSRSATEDLKDETLSQGTRDIIQGMVDLDLRRKAVLSSMELQPHLA